MKLKDGGIMYNNGNGDILRIIFYILGVVTGILFIYLMTESGIL